MFTPVRPIVARGGCPRPVVAVESTADGGAVTAARRTRVHGVDAPLGLGKARLNLRAGEILDDVQIVRGQVHHDAHILDARREGAHALVLPSELDRQPDVVGVEDDARPSKAVAIRLVVTSA